MFSKADSNKDGTISFDEFISFLEKENKSLIVEHEKELRNAVADNMDKNQGIFSSNIIFASHYVR